MVDNLIFKHHVFDTAARLAVLPIVFPDLFRLFVGNCHFFDG